MTKTALITGASRGLGYALALALAPTHHIIAVGRTSGALEELDDAVQEAGGSATLAPMDITDDGAMQVLCRGIYDRWGQLDVWAHTAIHATTLSPANMIEAKEMTKAIAINVAATATLISYVAPLLGADGQAVFFEDRHIGKKFFGAYGATKAAQVALAKNWQNETIKTGPRVHVLAPDPMPTATRARFYPGEDQTGMSATAKQAQSVLEALDL